MMLNKAGNSNTQERIELILRFINLFGRERIDVLLAENKTILQQIVVD